MSRQIVIVGEAPSQFSDPKKPFFGASGRRLAEYSGFETVEQLAERATLVNVLRRWPGAGNAGEKGSRFPMARAKRAAEWMKLSPRANVVLAGKRVSEAFGISFSDFYTWKIVMHGNELVWFTSIPHPSGCNRYWNYPDNRRRAIAFLRSEVFGIIPYNKCLRAIADQA